MRLIDTNNLNDELVQVLITRLKNITNPLSFEEATKQIYALFGPANLKEYIIDTEEIEYILQVKRGQREANRFSMHLRFKETHHHLVRIDIDPNIAHNNPDGRKITGSHIHIYNNISPTQKDLFAYPLNEKDFPEINNIIDAFTAFLAYNNIN